MEQERDRVLRLLDSPKIRRLYANTYFCLEERLDEDGYLEESYVPGRYPGDFARSSAAFSLLMAETGELELAERGLRFVLDTMKRNKLTRPPHVMGKPVRSEDGGLRQELDMVNQLDGTGHILMAYGELALAYERTELLKDYWEAMAWIMDLHTDQPYFFANEGCSFPVAKLHLFLNTSFEHSREERYWCCFDLLTQSFMGAALERFVLLAKKMGQTSRAERWETRLSWLKEGIQKNLTICRNDRVCYGEMRLPDGNDGVAFDGMGWVNLSPVAASWEAMPEEVMANTVEALRERLWRPDPMGDGLHYLDKDTLPDGKPCYETIGKGNGWDMEYSRRTGDYGHIGEHLEFLSRRHDADVYGECMFFRDGFWHSRDNGNAEQCIWWCWAMARLRKTLGLPAKPDPTDRTQRPELPPKYTLSK